MGTHPIFESDFDCLTEKMWKKALVSSTGAVVALRLYHSSQAKSNELELKRVVCIARHGARTALGLTRNDETPLGYVEYNGEELFKVPHGIEKTRINLMTNNEQLKSQDFSSHAKYGAGLVSSGGAPVRLLPGNVKGGQLTRVGFEQAFELGQYLRDKYNIHDMSQVNCRSTAFQRTIETMQGIVTGIQPNQTVDVAVPDNIDEIVIFQRELLEKYPQISKVRKRLHDAVGTDRVNLELAEMASQLNQFSKVDIKDDDDTDGSVPSIPDSVFGLCATRDEFLSRQANHVSIAPPFDSGENDLMRLCALLYRRMFLIWCGRSEAERRIVMPLAMGRLLEYVASVSFSGKRLSIITAHDTTIVPLMVALRVPTHVMAHLPPYCAHFEFEFYQNQNGHELVQVCYQGEPIQLGGANGTIMTRDEFLSVTAWVRRTQAQFEAEALICGDELDGINEEQTLDYPNCEWQ